MTIVPPPTTVTPDPSPNCATASSAEVGNRTSVACVMDLPSVVGQRCESNAAVSQTIDYRFSPLARSGLLLAGDAPVLRVDTLNHDLDVRRIGARRLGERLGQRLDHLRDGLLRDAPVVELHLDHRHAGSPLSWLAVLGPSLTRPRQPTGAVTAARISSRAPASSAARAAALPASTARSSARKSRNGMSCASGVITSRASSRFRSARSTLPSTVARESVSMIDG